MSKTLKVGIAGYGVVGKKRRHFIDLHPDLMTVAVCDQTFNGNGQFEDGVRYFQSYPALLEQELDVLYVCMSNDMAATVTKAGLDRNLHVFCEKPPGRNLDEVAEVIQCERRHPSLKLKYGFNHRYHDSVKKALRIVRNEELGRLVNMRGIYGKSRLLSFDSDWRTKRAISGGGILLDQGIHMIDMMLLFAGDFTEVHSFVSNDFWHHDVEDNAYALLRTKNGVVAMLHSSATQWRHRFELEMCLERGTVILSGLLTGSKSYGAETITVAIKGENDHGDPVERTTRYNQDNSWREEVAEFADAIVNDKPIQHGSSLEALKALQLVCRVYCSDPEWREKYNLSDKIPVDMEWVI